MSLGRLLFSLLSLSALPSLLEAAPTPRPLPTPNHEFLTSGTVHAVAVDPSGRTLLGGAFEALGNLPRRNFGRVLPNGDPDAAFQCDVDGAVHDLVVDVTGEILIGGAFTQVNGVPRAGFARISANCVVDSFDAGLPAGSVVSAIVLEPMGGFVWIGGSFSAPRTSLALFAWNGQLMPASFLFDGPIRALESDGAGGVFAVGGFTRVDGNDQHGGAVHVRVDGQTGIASVDPGFTMWTDSTDAFHSLAVSADAVYLGGRIRSIRGQPYSGIAKVDRVTGQRDESFRAETDDDVMALLRWSDGAILAGGDLRTINLSPVGSLVRLDPQFGWVQAATNSRRDRASILEIIQVDSGTASVGGHFNLLDNAGTSGHGIVFVAPNSLLGIPGGQALARGNVHAHWQDPDGSLWVGGDFVQVDGVPMAGLARFDSTGQLDTTNTYEIRGGNGVTRIVRDDQGRTYVAGGFVWIGIEEILGLARFLPGGQFDFRLPLLQLPRPPLWEAFTPAMANDLVLHGSHAYIAGSFDQIQGTSGPIVNRNGLVRVDVETGIVDAGWNPFADAPTDQVVHRLLVDASRSRLIVGRSVAPQLLAVSLADGQTVADFLPGLDAGVVRALAHDPVADHLYVGGSGISIPSPRGPIRDLLRLSASHGNADASWYPGLMRASDIADISLDDGAGVYAAGRMGLAVGAPDTGVAHFSRASLERTWNPDFSPGLPIATRVRFHASDRTVTTSGGHLDTEADTRIGIQRFPEVAFPYGNGFE